MWSAPQLMISEILNSGFWAVSKTIRYLSRAYSLNTANVGHAPVGYCDAVGAALIKYMGNAYLALKVSMLNQYYELWEQLGCTTEWSELAKIWHLDARIGDSHYDIPGPDGDRGWGGNCFPKDVNALLREAEAQGVSLSILEEAWTYNKSIRTKINWVDDAEAT